MTEYDSIATIGSRVHLFATIIGYIVVMVIGIAIGHWII